MFLFGFLVGVVVGPIALAVFVFYRLFYCSHQNGAAQLKTPVPTAAETSSASSTHFSCLIERHDEARSRRQFTPNTPPG